MKTYLFITVLLLIMIVPTSTLSQEKPESFTAKVITNTNKLITIKFSEDLSENMEYYEVVGNNKTILFGDSKLIYRLHNEPGLLAFRLIIDKSIMTLEFIAKKPDTVQRSNILNRIIKIAQSITSPESQLEIDGYDPLLSVNLLPTINKTVPPPIFKKRALPSGSKPI